jgi:DNA-binding beta-propeller fold protein YncE
MKTVKKGLGSLIVATTLSLLAGTQNLSAEDYGIRAFYGDKLLDRVVVMDVDAMSMTDEVYTEGEDPYPVDQAGNLDKVYAITRGSDSIDVIDASTLEKKGLIILPHHPRSSEAYNAILGLQLVTGADKPMASLIDVATDTVVASVGINENFSVEDYGGSNATGHPFWFNDDMFALIDRPNRTIHLYQVKKAKGRHGAKFNVVLLDSVSTPTAVHHFVKRKLFTNGKDQRTYYALSEGSPDAGIAPSILKYRLTRTNQLKFIAKTPLSSENIELMGSHHADMHPDGIHMYIGSTEGNMYVLNTDTMKIVKKIPVGLGAGHTTFVPDRNLAVVTNHKDTFITIVDTNTHTAIKNVTVSGAQMNDQILQSHSSFVHPNMNFFYAFATDNGIFYELDLETLEISRTVETGGTPLQGVFMCKGAECENLM